MRDHWRDCFVNIEEAGTDHFDDEQFRQLLDAATLETKVAELGLGTRAVQALDGIDIVNVEQLLAASLGNIHRMKGVGRSTIDLIKKAVRTLKERLEEPPPAEVVVAPEDDESNIERLSIHQLFQRVSSIGKAQSEEAQAALPVYLGTADETIYWPSLAQLSDRVGQSRPEVHQWVAAFRDRWRRDPALTRVRTDIDELLQSNGRVMTAPEIASALLVSRGCHQVEPHRTRYAKAVVCAAVEVEIAKTDREFLLRRGETTFIVAKDSDLAQFATDLAMEADLLAKAAAEGPLVSPSRALEQLRALAEECEVQLSDNRLLRLAANASAYAALSSRNEFYPREMDAGRAIKLSQNALYGASKLTIKQLKSRILSRYPLCAPIPDHPELGKLLEDAGFDYKWDSTTSSYVSNTKDLMRVTSGSESLSQFATSKHQREAGEVTPELAAERQFIDQIQHAEKDGAFQALVVDPKYYHVAIRGLTAEFDVELLDLEGMFLDTMRESAAKAGVDWDLILNTDATPGKGGWRNLMLLVDKRVMPAVSEQILTHKGKNVLLIYPALSAL